MDAADTVTTEVRAKLSEPWLIRDNSPQWMLNPFAVIDNQAWSHAHHYNMAWFLQILDAYCEVPDQRGAIQGTIPRRGECAETLAHELGGRVSWDLAQENDGDERVFNDALLRRFTERQRILAAEALVAEEAKRIRRMAETIVQNPEMFKALTDAAKAANEKVKVFKEALGG